MLINFVYQPMVTLYFRQEEQGIYHTEWWSTVGDQIFLKVIHRGSYMSAPVLLNLLNELRKRDKMRGLPSILSLFFATSLIIQEREC